MVTIIMAKPIPTKEKGLAKWSTRDLLITAIISIAFAVILLGVAYLFILFIRPLGLLAQTLGQGIWFIPAIFMGYILRRPGAVIVSQLMMRIILVPISPYGWMELVGAFVVGVPIELVFWATRYRHYRLPVLMLTGIAAGSLRTVVAWVPYGLSELTSEFQITVIVLTIVSGALAGWLAKLLADAIAKTGVLSGYAVGQEHQEEV